LDPRSLRFFRDSCVSASNMIAMKQTTLDRRAKECVTDFLLAWSESATMKNKLLDCMNK